MTDEELHDALEEARRRADDAHERAMRDVSRRTVDEIRRRQQCEAYEMAQRARGMR